MRRELLPRAPAFDVHLPTANLIIYQPPITHHIVL